MPYLHNTTIRRLVTILFLLSSLSIQAQTLFDCNMLDMAPVTKCCCEASSNSGCAMGGGCDFSGVVSSDYCCDVTVDVNLQDNAVVSSADTRLTQLDAPQPPPALFFETNLAFAPAAITTTSEYHTTTATSWKSGTHTYLLTSRFRI